MGGIDELQAQEFSQALKGLGFVVASHLQGFDQGSAAEGLILGAEDQARLGCAASFEVHRFGGAFGEGHVLDARAAPKIAAPHREVNLGVGGEQGLSPLLGRRQGTSRVFGMHREGLQVLGRADLLDGA